MSDFEKLCSEHFVIAGTGSRDFELLSPEIKDAVVGELCEFFAEVAKREDKPLLIMSGGAEGWDLWVAYAAYKAKIPYVCCIPNKGYGNYYYSGARSKTNKDRRRTFDAMLENAAGVEYLMEDVLKLRGLYAPKPGGGTEHSNFARNRRMVDLADGFVVYDPSSRGTSHCFALIRRTDKPYKIFKKRS